MPRDWKGGNASTFKTIGASNHCEHERARLFENYPPRRVWVSRARLKCAKNGDFENSPGSATAYGWFVWEKGWKGKPEIGWFN